MNLDIDYSKIKDYEEYKLFFLVDECNVYIFTCNETMKLKDLNDEERQEMLDNSIKVRKIRIESSNVTKERYGFEVVDELGKLTEKYMEWFHKWNEWRFDFSDDEWNEIHEKLVNNEDIKEYLPE
jgi:hypothetical protein